MSIHTITFSVLGPDIFLTIVFPYTLDIHSYVNVRDQISRTY